ncbi:FUSC family protein [Scopulibacillus cellulosilyticus]|uniref:Aromatic acid exporter family protein n=1 Tax=Scopulibacillus cellulosilyticus TaxID=2665665 RepID=A0ABW2Q1P3_9BACL
MIKTIVNFFNKTSIIWQTALASAVSWQLAKWSGSKDPFLAPLTAILCLQQSIDKSIRFAFQRVVGTMIGIIVIECIVQFLHVNFWTLFFVILISVSIGYWLNFNQVVVRQISLSVLLVFLLTSHSHEYGIDRLRDTFIGAVISIIVCLFLFPPDFTKKVKQSILTFTDHLSDNFTNTAKWIENGCKIEEGKQIQNNTKNLLNECHQVSTQLESALKNNRLNIYSKKNRARLAEYQQQLLNLRKGYTHISGMVRTTMDWSASGNMTPSDKNIWSQYMHQFAVYIQAWKQTINNQAVYINKQAAQITLPKDMDKIQYRYSLYNAAYEFIQDFKR